MIGKLRVFIAGAALALMLCQHASAGVVCEAIGKCWDKAAGKIVKVHKATQAHLKDAHQSRKAAQRASGHRHGK